MRSSASLARQAPFVNTSRVPNPAWCHGAELSTGYAVVLRILRPCHAEERSEEEFYSLPELHLILCWWGYRRWIQLLQQLCGSRRKWIRGKCADEIAQLCNRVLLSMVLQQKVYQLQSSLRHGGTQLNCFSQRGFCFFEAPFAEVD